MSFQKMNRLPDSSRSDVSIPPEQHPGDHQTDATSEGRQQTLHKKTLEEEEEEADNVERGIKTLTHQAQTLGN